jgi:hypothetical protein
LNPRAIICDFFESFIRRHRHIVQPRMQEKEMETMECGAAGEGRVLLEEEENLPGIRKGALVGKTGDFEMQTLLTLSVMRAAHGRKKSISNLSAFYQHCHVHQHRLVQNPEAFGRISAWRTLAGGGAAVMLLVLVMTVSILAAALT